MAFEGSVYLALNEKLWGFPPHEMQAGKTSHISALQNYSALLTHTNSQHFTKRKSISVVNRSREKREASDLEIKETLCSTN